MRRRRTRVRAIALLAVLGACGARSVEGPDAAVRWLLAQQGQDGAFRSARYGVLRAGHSTTALALLALTHAPPAQVRTVAPAIARGLDFLARAGVVPTGADASVDYPTYTAACWLAVLARVKTKQHADVPAQLIAFLRTRQLNEDAGWVEADAAYGGFDFGARVGAKPIGEDGVALGTTTWVIEALRAAGVPADDPMLQRARTFVHRCQIWVPEEPARHGGFVHSPVPGLLQSKAGHADGAPTQPLPYASCTCDGLLALAALGEGGTEAAAAAAKWLAAHARIPEVGGFADAGDHARAIEPSLRAYALSALARCAPLRRADDAAAIAAAWRTRQQSDGSILGWGELLKEDDPLVATCLALRGWPQAR